MGVFGALVPSKRPEWFYAPMSWLPDVGFAPVVHIVRGRIEVHRTHLPILARTHPEAQALLDDLEISVNTVLAPQEGWTAREYQKQAAYFARSRRGTLLADMMRLGKTGSSLLSHDPAEGPLIVVAPLSTREVWVTWIERVFGRTPYIVVGRKGADPARVREHPFVFIHYDVLMAWAGCAPAWRIATLIYDEIHLLAHASSQRARAALAFGNHAERRIGLSGTPMWNRPIGMWTLLTCISPGSFGPRFEFGQRYCAPVPGAHGWQYTGTSNEEEFRERLAQVMLRRTWEDVRAELPPTSRTVEVAECTPAKAREIDFAAQSARDARNVETCVGAVARLRQLLGSAKATLAADLALRVLEGGEAVVVWVWHRKVAKAVADRLAKLTSEAVFVVTGAQPAAQREETMRAWKQMPCAPLIITIAVGQVGIDLSHARQEIFAEVDFTPAVIAQAEMRTFSPDRPMAVTYLIVDHPIDRQLVGALVEKCAHAERLGVPAAETAIDVVAEAFGLDAKKADLARLMAALIAAADEIGDAL